MRNGVATGLALAVAASLIVAIAAGCGGDGAAANPAGEPRASRDLALLTRAAGARDEPTALVGGLLRFDRKRRCVLLSGRAVVWPSGTTLHGNTAVRLPSGIVARAGDRVIGAGGVMPASSVATLGLVARRDFAALNRCARNVEVVVFSASGEDVAVGKR